MENGLTFRFEAADIQNLLSGAVPAKYLHISFYLELTDDKKNSVMKAKAEAFASNSTRVGDTSGCPVPPCAFTSDGTNDPTCGKLVDEILEANSIK